MRLWSLHPRYLDAKGLVALWREALLAQKVLHGNTKGYRNHPQLTRFKQQQNPLAAIAAYLREVQREAPRYEAPRREAAPRVEAPREMNVPTIQRSAPSNPRSSEPRVDAPRGGGSRGGDGGGSRGESSRRAR